MVSAVDRPSDYYRPESLETYWYWINERHRMFLKRWRGDPKPWTEDKVLQDWKFCNVFRKNDKQSKLLIDNVILPHWNKTSNGVSSGVEHAGLMLFNIYAFRAFNWWPTFHRLADVMGKDNQITKWDPDVAVELLHDWTEIAGEKLTSGAYMIRGREGMPKYQSIVQTLDHVWRMKKTLGYIIKQNVTTMEQAQEILLEAGFWGWGHFTTYQVVLDLMESPLLESPTDVNTWCEFGPGAVRGIRLIWPKLRSAEFLPQAIDMQKHQEGWRESHVPELNLQDIEFSLCELSKYLRIKNGGKGKEGYAGS